MAGGGGALITYTAKWVRGFAANLGVCSSVKAELLTLLHGLKMAWACGIKKLLINVDSTIVINKIQVPSRPNRLHYFIIKECQTYIYNLGWDVVIEHCYRAANIVADHLANLGIEQQETLIFFDSSSASIKTFLFEDLCGVYHSCFVRNH